jgi:hypothetical protein
MLIRSSIDNQQHLFIFKLTHYQKLEQFQDYLRLLTNTDVEMVDDKKAIEFLQEHNAATPH